jgi:hypothetical protein
VTFEEMEAALRERLEATRWRLAPNSCTSCAYPASTGPTGSASSRATRKAAPSPSCSSTARRIGRSGPCSSGCWESAAEVADLEHALSCPR